MTTIKFNEKQMKYGKNMVLAFASHVKAEADKVLASGSLKFALPSAMPTVGENAAMSGTSQFFSRTANCATEVGQVIVTMNTINNLTVYGNYGLAHGFATVTDMKQGTTKAKMMANTIELLLNFLGGGKGKDAYESPFEGDAWEQEGFHCVKVNPARAHEVFANLKKMGAEYTIKEVIHVGIDSAAITRMNSESTIDSDKKVKLVVVTGLPGIAELAGVTQLGRKNMEVQVNWAKKETVFLFDGKIAKLSDKQTGGEGSYVYKTKEGEERITLCDFHHLFRRSMFKKLISFGDGLRDFGVNEVQKINDEEIARIMNIFADYSQYKVADSILEIKGWWQTASDVSRKEQANAVVKGIPLAVSEADADIAKEEKAVQYKYLSNRMRLLLGSLERVSKTVISPEDKIRIIWGTLLTKNRAENKGQIAWDKVSDFASSIMPEEYALWVLDVTKDDPRVPHKTRDRIYNVGILKDADIVNLRNLKGAKVRFDKGMCWVNGRAAFKADTPIDGVFEIEVVEEKGNVRLFATCDIRSLIKVPAADKTSLCVYLQTSDNPTIIDETVDKVFDGEVIVKATKGNPLVIGKNDQILLSTHFQGKANRVNNKVINDEDGVTGTVQIAKKYEYIDNGKVRYGAFLLLENVKKI